MIMKYSAIPGKLVTMETRTTFTPGAFPNPTEVKGHKAGILMMFKARQAEFWPVYYEGPIVTLIFIWQH